MLPQDETLLADDSVRQMLVDLDYQEVITYSFVDPAWETALDPAACPLPLANPLASQLSAMRTTLWGGLIETLRHNLNRQQARVRIFELGRVYRSQTAQPMKLGGLVYGDVLPEQWGAAARRVDFFDLKGDLERLFGYELESRRGEHPALHPGRAPRCGPMAGHRLDWCLASPSGAGVRLAGRAGTVRARQPGAGAAWSAASCDPVALSVGAARPGVRAGRLYPAGELLTVLRDAAAEGVRSIEVFDEYRGKGVPENQKSLAIRVVMQDTERTLTDQEVEDAVQKLVDAALRQCNASLRT